MNLFYESISKFLETPRDVTRLTNALSVTFRAVAGEVNAVDFVAVESLRLFCPTVYHVIRENREMFTGSGPTDYTRPNRDDLAAFHERWLGKLRQSQPQYAEPVKAMVVRLFPKLASIWGNTNYPSEWEAGWRRELRVCSTDIFPIYFSLAVASGDLSNAEIQRILATAQDAAQFARELLTLKQQVRPDGWTRLSAFLDRLQDYTRSEIPTQHIEPIVSVLLDVGDELGTPGELAGAGPRGASDSILITGVVWQLIKRLDMQTRFNILERAIAGGRAVYMTQEIVATLGQQQGRYAGRQADPEQEWLVSGEQLSNLEKLTLQKIKTAARNGSLLRCPGLLLPLSFWRRQCGDKEVKSWASKVTEQDENLALFLEGCLSSASSTAPGDAVSETHDWLDPEWLGPYLDLDKTAERARSLVRSDSISGRQKRALKQFLKQYEFRKSGGNPNSPRGFAALSRDDT
jgi:predicted KAP-like P-loop ATPase